MKIGIDVSPLHTGHKVRGIGFYTQRLVKALKKVQKFKPQKFEIRELKSEKEIRKQEYDLLHIPYFNPYFITLPWPWQIKKPIVVTIHDLIPVKYPDHYPPGIKGKLRWQMQKLLLKQARLVITDSFASKYDIGSYAKYPLDKIYVTYLAAGEEFCRLEDGNWKLEVREKYDLPKKFCLFVGDINWNKNIPSLVKACEKIKMPLVIVGKQAVSNDYDKNHVENKDLVWLQNKVTKQRGDKATRLLGYVPTSDLVKIYNLATVYCQPSFDEGFGLPVLEAMACGCPVVSSNQGSLLEVVGDAGILVEPNVDNLSKAIKKLHSNDSNDYSVLVEKGLQRAKKFSWQKTAVETSKIYRTAMEF